MGGACSMYGWEEWCIQCFGGETWGKETTWRRPRHRWEDNIKMDLQIVGWWGIDWIDLVQDRDRWRAVLNLVINLRVRYNAGNFLTSWEPVNISRRPVFHGVCKQECARSATHMRMVLTLDNVSSDSAASKHFSRPAPSQFINAPLVSEWPYTFTFGRK